ncbi:MAG: hypothetical protein NT105_23875 [Verrucomicrobia bacterium]|nr:hypothetical protein [Verrucomicrobiota bacterium]
MSATRHLPARRALRRLAAASAQMLGGDVAVCLTVAGPKGARVERYLCSAVDAMALATMLQLAVARAAKAES